MTHMHAFHLWLEANHIYIYIRGDPLVIKLYVHRDYDCDRISVKLACSFSSMSDFLRIFMA